MTLTDRIQEAEEAKAAIAETQQLEERAAGLEALLQEQAQAEQLAQALSKVADVTKLAEIQFSHAHKAATSWRQRFGAVCQEIEQLANELPEVQGQIFAPGRELFRVIQSLHSVGYERPETLTGFERGESLASKQGRGVSLSRVLAEVGGLSPELSVFGDMTGVDVGSLKAKIAKLLRRGFRGPIFDPGRGARNFY